MPDEYRDLTGNQRRRPFIGQGTAWPQTFQSEASGILLVASDGLFKYASPEDICAAVRRNVLEDAVERLINLVRLRSGSLWDDVSLILCRL